MKSSVTPDFLLQGAYFALEQCGLLLRDALRLFVGDAYASAIALSAFAREELGKEKILLELRTRVQAGEAITLGKVKAACKEHVIKQDRGLLSMTTQAQRDTGTEKLLWTRMHSHPQSPEWRAADEELKAIDKTRRKRIPGERHEKRMAALYVDPNHQSWNRPALLTREDARDFLTAAINDYAGEYDRRVNSICPFDIEIFETLERWVGRPELPKPEWPPYTQQL